MSILPISDTISYIEATNDPLSADIGIIRGPDATWLYDVGNDVSRIAPLQGSYHAVLSHFHQDHIGNLEHLHIENLYVSKYTHQHTKSGIIVDRDLYIGNLHIFPLPTSHAKGSLGLEVDGMYAFVGDATYCKANQSHYVYNAQLLKEEIAVLKKLSAPYLLLSHQKGLVASKDKIIQQLETVYAMRDPSSSEIRIKKE